MGRDKSKKAEAGTAPGTDELLIGVAVPEAPESTPVRAKTLPAERRAVRKFALRVLVFFAPLVLIIFGIELLLWIVGETWPLERVIRVQQTNPSALFSRAMIDQGTFRYKFLQILRRRPQILVLGSSRIMQFRAEMFGRDGASFYNAGGMIHSLQDVNDFLDRLPQEATPKTIILGIDFWWLNANSTREASDAFLAGIDDDGTYSWQGHATVISSYVRDPRSLGTLITHSIGPKRDANAIGLQALLHRQGFRPDGSKQFDVKVPKTPEEWRRRLPTLKTVKKDILGGGTHFEFTEGVSIPLLHELGATISRLKARGVFLIGYSPPVIAEWANLASTAPRQKDFWEQYHKNVPELFRSLDIPYFDIITPEQLGLDDHYMRDAYHAYDTFNLHVLQHFCDDPRVRAAFPDVSRVAQKALNSPGTNPLHLDLSGIDNPPKDPGR